MQFRKKIAHENYLECEKEATNDPFLEMFVHLLLLLLAQG
jgi:hypothetical protein